MSLILSSVAFAGVGGEVRDGKTGLSVTPTDEGAKITLTVGKSGVKSVQVLDKAKKVVATVYQGTLSEGAYTYLWKADSKVLTGAYTVTLSEGSSPSLTQEFSYTQPLIPSKSIWSTK